MNDRSLVVITGGTQGLGRELTLCFGRLGYFVIPVFHLNDTAAEDLDQVLASGKMLGRSVKHDIREPGLVSKIASLRKLDEFASITLINNAGAPFEPTPLHLFQWSAFESLYDVAFQGSWMSTKEFLPFMVKKKHGLIVNVLSSVIHGAPPKGFAPYVAAKYALQGFSKSLAAEYSSRGVRVFTVSPGFMETSLTKSWNAELKEAIHSASGRLSTEESAQKIAQLALSGETAGQGEDYKIS